MVWSLGRSTTLQQAPRHRLIPFFVPSGPIRVASLWPVVLVVQQSASSGGSQDVPGSFDICEHLPNHYSTPQLSPQSVAREVFQASDRLSHANHGGISTLCFRLGRFQGTFSRKRVNRNAVSTLRFRFGLFHTSFLMKNMKS